MKAPRKPTVLIGACGIGLGHVGRTLPVARSLRKRGWDVVFSTYGDSVSFCLKQGFPAFKEVELRYGVKPDGSLSLRETFRTSIKSLVSFASQLRSEISVIRHTRPTVVLSDSRLSTLIAARLLGVPSVLIMHEFKLLIPSEEDMRGPLRLLKQLFERAILEFFGLGWDLANRVLITDFPPPLTVAGPTVVLPEFLRHKAQFVGMVSSPRLGVSKPGARARLGVRQDRRLVYFGISGLPEERRKMSQVLLPIARRVSELGFSVVYTSGEPGGVAQTQVNRSFRVFPWIPDRSLAYEASDVFVTVGGQTSVGEALRYALPMIVIPTPNHSEHRVIGENIQRLGLGVKIEFRELCFDNFYRALNTVLGDGYLRNVQSAARFVEKYDAVELIVRAVEELASG